MLRAESSIPQFSRRLPKHTVPRLVGRELLIELAEGVARSVKIGAATQCVRFTLGTPDPSEAQRRSAAAHLFLDKLFQSMEAGQAVTLSHRQATALSAHLYRAWATEPDVFPQAALRPNVPGLPDAAPEDYAAESSKLAALADAVAREPADGLSCMFGAVAETILATVGVSDVAEASRRLLLSSLRLAFCEALRTRSRYAACDYTPDERLARFPVWEPPQAVSPPKQAGRYSPAVTQLSAIFDGWWAEAKAAGLAIGTRETYKIAVRSLGLMLGHEDARMISKQDILRYKEWRLTNRLGKSSRLPSPATVKGDLKALRQVFQWGVDNMLLVANPVDGIKVRAAKPIKIRERDFLPSEAAAILRASIAVELNAASPQADFARRWVPWICAYTGCRVGEAMQLRKQDFRLTDHPKALIMRITPEAGTVKTKVAREVPIHQHILDQGFLSWLEEQQEGHLFVTVKEDKTFRNTLRGRKNRLTQWVRTLVPDPNVAPNHAWRHSFKSRGFEAGIQEKVLDAICGHVPGSVARQYGSVTLKTKVDAVAMYPAYSLAEVEDNLVPFRSARLVGTSAAAVM